MSILRRGKAKAAKVEFVTVTTKYRSGALAWATPSPQQTVAFAAVQIALASGKRVECFIDDGVMSFMPINDEVKK